MTGRGRLAGVVRVRAIRERDSRIGFATALEEEHRAAAQVTRIEELLATLPQPSVQDLAGFAARQHTATALGEALRRARAELASAHRITLTARDRWRSDRSRLAAVESLVDRRAAARAAVARRRETRELDAIAEDLWRRRHHGEAAG